MHLLYESAGLRGGLNTFGYVGGNPLGFSDPEGLDFLTDVFGFGNRNGDNLPSDASPEQRRGQIRSRLGDQLESLSYATASAVGSCLKCVATCYIQGKVDELGMKALAQSIANAALKNGVKAAIPIIWST